MAVTMDVIREEAQLNMEAMDCRAGYRHSRDTVLVYALGGKLERGTVINWRMDFRLQNRII